MIVRGASDARFVAKVESARALLGVRAGSGLVRRGGELILVQDDAFAIARIDVDTFAVRVVPIRGDGRALEKALKPDFEAALAPDGTLWLFGSGSTEGRCRLARVDLERETATFHDRPAIYAAVSAAAGLRGRPNIEGVLLDERQLRLFHRGAGDEPCAIVTVDARTLSDASPAVLDVRAYELGALDGVRLAFTDATLTKGSAWFLAAAEQTDNAIDDGRVAGSVLGRLTAKGAAAWTPLVDSGGDVVACKAEGLSVDDDERAAWVVTDPDDAATPASLLRLALDGWSEHAR